jgi:hypothetical protein
MIDRNARQELAREIRRYLSDEITAFQFDEILQEFRCSPDETTRFIAFQLWYFYDDCEDHFVVLSKQGWNYIQRLLLLLESDFEVKQWTVTHWHFTQAIAAMLLTACLAIVTMAGVGYHLLLYFVPFGGLSILLAYLRRQADAPLRRHGPFDAILTPFESFQDLRVAYDSVGFRKMRYPSPLKSRTIRSAEGDGLLRLQLYLGWLLWCPVVLFFQCFPLRESRIHVARSGWK